MKPTHKAARWTIVLMAMAWTSLIVPSVTAQTVETKRVMQKLAQSQQLLGALVTSNWNGTQPAHLSATGITSQPG